MSTLPVIEVKHIGKRYDITHQRGGYVALRDVLATIARRPFAFLKQKAKRVAGFAAKEEFWALRDVNLTVEKGDIVGIIGANGAGKSTLLKILTGITPPTEGEIILRGRVASLLEVGTGFHPELTGRENILLNGAILGMGRREIARKFDEIVAFAGIEKFLDTPVKRYSSGMYVRLAFSVAAHLEPDILLVDEVLAVGDAEFQRKCLGKMEEITRKDGRTIFFVSHNINAIQTLCPKSILLKKGHVAAAGKTEDVIEAYLKDASEAVSGDVRERHDRSGNGELRITNAYLLDESGARVASAVSGKDVRVALEYECTPGARLENIVLGMGVMSSRGESVFICHTDMTRTDLGTLEGSGVFTCAIKELPLVPGVYSLNARVTSHGEELDYLHDILSFEVLDGDFFGTGVSMRHSLVYVHHAWKNERR